MRYTLLLLCIIAFSANGSGWDPGAPYTPPGMHDSYDGGARWQEYVQDAYKPRITHSRRNIFGGEDFYGNKGFMGRSRPNVFGGRDFYPSPNVDW